MFCDKLKQENEKLKQDVEKLLQYIQHSLHSQENLIEALREKQTKSVIRALKNDKITEKGALKARKKFLKLLDQTYYKDIALVEDKLKEFDKYSKT